jgi:transmembrane sensor
MNASFTDHTIAAAARWYARLQALDCTPAERAEFARWCAADPSHAAAYAAARDIAARVTRLATSNARLRAMADAALAKPAGVPELSKRRAAGIAAALAASIVAAFGAATFLRGLPEPTAPPSATVFTSDREARSLTLDDGTVVHLDVQTELEVRFNAHQRQVWLQHGRALFDVAHDTERPFTVTAGIGRVTAVGTRFQVQRLGEAVVVTLAEGIVTVNDDRGASRRLVPGDELSLASPDASWARRSVDTRAATSWTLGRLVFRATRLDDAVAEVNRYAGTKVRIVDDSLADLPVSGSFVVGDGRAAVGAFAAVLPLTVIEQDGELKLYRRQSEQQQY